LERLALAEEKKVLANRAYRTSARTLRRLSKALWIHEMPGAEVGRMGRLCQCATLVFAPQRRMAREFDGDAEKMRKACIEKDRPRS